MDAIWYAVFVLLVGYAASSFGDLADASRPAPGHVASGGLGYSQDHVVVTLRDTDADPTTLTRSTLSAGGLASLSAQLDLPTGAVLRESLVTRWRRGRTTAEGAGPAVPLIDTPDFYYVSVPDGLSPDDMVDRLSRNALVATAEKDPIGSGGAVPSSVFYAACQWHLWTNAPAGRIRAPEAWDIATGTNSVVIALLDTGCCTNFPEFRGRTVAGLDVINDDFDPFDDNGHGTAVGAALCANPDASSLVAGVDWQCRLMPVKVLDASNEGLYSQWADGISWAVANGAKVLNLSLGGLDPSGGSAVEAAISNAIAQGCIVVTIAHNDGGALRFPGSLPEVITVGATDSNSVRTAFSNYGSALDIMAPGLNVGTISTNQEAARWWGTSMSAPQVSGGVGLLCSLRPDLTQDEAAILLGAGADDGAGDALDTEGRDDYYGWGRLNLYNSLVLAGTAVSTMVRTNGQDIAVSWAAPPNAADRKPYDIRFAPTLTGAWSTITAPSNIVYGSSIATWIDDGTETGGLPTAGQERFYRIRVKLR